MLRELSVRFGRTEGEADPYFRKVSTLKTDGQTISGIYRKALPLKTEEKNIILLCIYS